MLRAADKACGGRAEAVTELGHVLWPKLAAAYIERRLSPAVPQSEAGLDGFQRLARAAERFEGEATATGCQLLHLLTTLPCSPSPPQPSSACKCTAQSIAGLPWCKRGLPKEAYLDSA